MQGLQLTWRQLLANQGTLLVKTSIALFAAAAATVLFSNTVLAQNNLLPVATSDSVSTMVMPSALVSLEISSASERQRTPDSEVGSE